MIKIEVVESEFNPVTFVVTESEAEALVKETRNICMGLYNKREQLTSSGDWAEPYSELERSQIDAISYVLDGVTYFQKSEHKKFMALLKERLDYQVSESGATVNMRHFQVNGAEFINRRYIEEIARKLKQAIEEYNREHI